MQVTIMRKLCSQAILFEQSGTKLSLKGLISTTNRIQNFL